MLKKYHISYNIIRHNSTIDKLTYMKWWRRLGRNARQQQWKVQLNLLFSWTCKLSQVQWSHSKNRCLVFKSLVQALKQRQHEINFLHQQEVHATQTHPPMTRPRNKIISKSLTQKGITSISPIKLVKWMEQLQAS